MGVTEDKIRQIIDRDPDIFTKREVLAMRFSDVILPNFEDQEDKNQLFKELDDEFTYEELTELGCFIALCVGFVPFIHAIEL